MSVIFSWACTLLLSSQEILSGVVITTFTDHEWRSSIACKSFGAIALISSEVCVLTLAVITYDRRAKLVHDVKDDTMRHRTVWLILSSIWLISSAIAVVPAVVKSYFYDEEKGEDYYGTNGLCLPLQLPGEKDPAWEYCLAVFGVFNFSVACYMAWAYCTIFYTSYVSVRASENAKAMKDERKMAIRFCFIVFTDILCWFPIAILIYISLAGIVSDKENKLYAWFSICVATINSVINPFIYTITTPLFWPKFKGWFEKISRCCEKCKVFKTIFTFLIFSEQLHLRILIFIMLRIFETSLTYKQKKLENRGRERINMIQKTKL